MSGTSGDGVDIAVTRIAGRDIRAMTVKLVHHHHVPFDAGLRTQLFAIRDSENARCVIWRILDVKYR